jgi:hypothetical protein
MTLLIDDPTVKYTRVAYAFLFGGYDAARPAHRWVYRQWEAGVGRWAAFKAKGPVDGGWLWWLLCVEKEEGEGEDEPHHHQRRRSRGGGGEGGVVGKDGGRSSSASAIEMLVERGPQ